MSQVVAVPDLVATAAAELAATGSAIDSAGASAAKATTSLLTAAADEVSTGVAAFFDTYGQQYQAASAQVAQFHQRFVQNLASAATAYLSTEIGSATSMLGGDTMTGAAAATRITVPGAGPLYIPDVLLRLPYLGQVLLQGGIPGPASVSLLQGYILQNTAIGQNWFSDSIAQVVNYPASMGLLSGNLWAPSVNDAVAVGQRLLNDQIATAVAASGGSPVQIAGLSEGTLVVNRELAYLATSPTAPPPSALQFAMFSSPEVGGLASTYLPNGITVPLLGYTSQSLANTQYNVSVVFGQYDGWSNPPDRPWNLPAVVNSMFGILYQHNPAALTSLSNAVTLSSVTTAAGGTVTTYMIPAPTLPMLLPLAQIGVPQPIVGGLNSLLKPIVDAGYSSLTPTAGPYFSHGSLIGLPTAADVLGDLLT
ncbi:MULTISPECIES: PE-PPE domain-containing protein [Mycobacterium]|uniref:PE-PPE domain-containing protein n=1 Tax=Mycobacterium TaxID=1763 RepID=UPI001EEFCE0E|nr:MULTISPECIES: PE-PPE domain-containing protein [Mycobacterium]GLD02755.1 hypothetical protein Mkiyose1088_46210 [Mycobacterium kiyosense]